VADSADSYGGPFAAGGARSRDGGGTRLGTPQKEKRPPLGAAAILLRGMPANRLRSAYRVAAFGIFTTSGCVDSFG
jgi:hypothetical protein